MNIDHKEIFYKDSRCTLILGDSTKPDLFDSEFIDLIVTSPPYNIGRNYNLYNDSKPYDVYLEFSEQWLKNCYNWSKQNARLCLNIPFDIRTLSTRSPISADIIKIAQDIGWKYFSVIYWNKSQVPNRYAWGSWKSPSAPNIPTPVELVILMYKDSWKKKSTEPPDITRDEFIEWTYGLWKFNGETSRKIMHPAPFPRELPKRCIKLFSFPKDVVFDPFCGSGTTVLEAVNNNRYGIGVDIDPEYLSTAKRRILELGS